MRAVVVAVVILLSGCAQAPSRTDDGIPSFPFQSPTPVPRHDLTFRDVANGSYGAIVESSRVVIADEPAWRAFWANLTADEQPAPPAPAVDLGNETIAAVTMGERSSGCYAIRITGVFDDGGRIHANVTSYGPRPGEGCTASITHPYDIIAIKGAELTIVFEG